MPDDHLHGNVILDVLDSGVLGELIDVGVWQRPPNVLVAPNPASSMRTNRMFGDPFGAVSELNIALSACASW